jgi:ACS family hexuronate transporter-like MFS transporter
VPWKITLLIAAAIAISYFDRQTLPVAIAAIQRDIPISNSQFSQLQAAFLVAYALMYAGGGKLIDVIGTRKGFAAVMVWWSLACAGHGLANGFGFLMASRFLLGMGEGGGFPAATKAVGEWFSARDRATAMGVINAGTAVGAVIAPPAIAAIITMGGWRWVFVIAGGVGLLWAAYWLMAVKEAPQQESEPPVAWLPLLRCKEIWALIVAKFLSDAAWYLYLFWLPKYLYDVRGFDTKRVGYYAWIPYAASGIGSLAGGWFSSWLLRQGCSVNKARKIALGASAAVMPIIFLVDSAPVDLAIAIFSVAFFGQQSWSTLVMTLPTDLVTGRAVGSVAGLVGFGGAMGGVVFGLVVGFVLDHGYGYGPVFAMAGIFHVLAFLLILLVIPVIKRVELK